MKDKIDILRQLQTIEIETNKIKAGRERSIISKAKMDARLMSFEQNVKTEMTRLDLIKKEYRQLEMDVLANQSLIDKSHQKLRSVKTNKEYQFMLKEIDELKSQNSRIEDRMLECLEQMEALEKNIQISKREYETFKKKAAKEKELIEADNIEGERLQAEMTSKWDQVSQQADPDLLKKYLSIKKKANGIALATVSSEMCNGCNLNIPPQLYNEILKGNEVILCPHCHRILFSER